MKFVRHLPVPAAGLSRANGPISHSRTLPTGLQDGTLYWGWALWVPGMPLGCHVEGWSVAPAMNTSDLGLQLVGYVANYRNGLNETIKGRVHFIEKRNA